MHSSGDICSGHYFTESELAWFWMHTVLVTQSVACLVSVSELVWFNMHSPGDTDWPALFQVVSWPCFECVLFWWHCGLSCFRGWVGLVFNVHFWWHRLACLVSGGKLAGLECASSGDTDCGLSCFSQWVGLIFNVYSSGDTDCGLSCFRWWVSLGFYDTCLW